MGIHPRLSQCQPTLNLGSPESPPQTALQGTSGPGWPGRGYAAVGHVVAPAHRECRKGRGCEAVGTPALGRGGPTGSEPGQLQLESPPGRALWGKGAALSGGLWVCGVPPGRPVVAPRSLNSLHRSDWCCLLGPRVPGCSPSRARGRGVSKNPLGRGLLGTAQCPHSEPCPHPEGSPSLPHPGLSSCPHLCLHHAHLDPPAALPPPSPLRAASEPPCCALLCSQHCLEPLPVPWCGSHCHMSQ